MKIALITDTHWGCRGDSPVFARRIAKFYAEQFFPYIDKHEIKQIIHLGDILDDANTNRMYIYDHEYLQPGFIGQPLKDLTRFTDRFGLWQFLHQSLFWDNILYTT